MPDLAALTLSDMVALSAALRRTGSGAQSMEQVADAVVRRLYDSLEGSGRRNCVMVRFFKTHRFDQLDGSARAAAQAMAGEEGLAPSTKCLTLLASAGDEAEWNDRSSSVAHQAVPLVSNEMIQRFPMISQLISQLGVETSSLLEADPELVVRLDERTYNVFHVPVAVGSAHIPAQEDFVLRHGIQSVVGFGGMLASGDLFAVVLFSRAVVTERTAELLETLALSIKVAVQPFARGPVFSDGRGPSGTARPPGMHQVRAVEQLLEVHERTVEVQAATLELAHHREQVRSHQLRALADATVLVSATRSLEEILTLVKDKAREIIGAHQSAATLALDGDVSGNDHLVRQTNQPLRLPGYLGVPLISRTGTNLGLLQLSGRREGDFTSDDEAIVVQLAQFASVTIENAVAYARERDLAAALQHSLLPESLPEMAGLDIAVRYLAGTAGVEVGGDFYDALPVSESEVALVIGDVAGHDVRAAITMGRVRHAIQAYAIEDPDPASVMRRLNHFVAHELEAFITALYLVLDVRTGEVRIVNAGHLPPLVVDSRTGASSYLECGPVPPIGVRPHGHFVARSARIPDGSTVVLFTDGLVERRGENIDLGLDRLRSAGAGAKDDTPAVLLEHLLSTLPGSTRPDDIALVAARMTGRQETGGD